MEGLTEWESVFRPQSVPLVEGDWISRQNYSRALTSIAHHGPDVFYGRPNNKERDLDGNDDGSYNGAWIAQNIVDTVKRAGGILTRDDLSNYQARVYEPIVGEYNGKRIHTTDAPTCGPVLLGIFNILSSFNLHNSGSAGLAEAQNATRTGLTMHRLTEAIKFAFGARTEISDPDERFMNETRRHRVDEFSKQKWARDVLTELTDVSGPLNVWCTLSFPRSFIHYQSQNTTHTADYYHPVFDVPSDSGTTHLSVIDRWGGAVSLTST